MKITPKLTFGFIILAVFVVSFLFLQIWQDRLATAVIQVGEKKLYVQVAKTIGQQRSGLGGREQLLPYGGMIFPHSPAQRIGIVMRDMEFPIDIIWIRGDTIVDIAPEIQPEPGVPESELKRYYPRIESDLVLEVAAGFVEQYNISIGDKIIVIEE